MAGIVDVAREAGVSTATVSRALSGKDYVSRETKELVEEVAARLGYVPSASASTLVTGRTKNIGVVVPYVDRWFFATALETVDRELVKAGYDVTLYNLSSGDAHRRSIFKSSLPRKRVDAVMCISVRMTDEELASLNAVNKPIVSLGGLIEGARNIKINDTAAGKLATDHLIAMGHTKIAMIGLSGSDDKFFRVFDERRDGYESALKQAGIEPKASWYKQVAKYAISEGYAAAKQLLGDPHNSPTAIFASSDELAVGALLAAKDMGLKVPQDVSIVGVDNHELADFFGITTIDQNVTGQAEQLVKMMLQLLDNPNQAKDSVLEWPIELVVRASTTKARN
jgi:DNA-binding LacI/PurR family transcriptional regulator